MATGTISAVRALRARIAEIEQAIFVRVQGSAFDRAGMQDAEYLAGLRAAVAAAVEYALEGIEQGEGWAGPIPVVAVEQAHRAARAGVSLDTVLRRYVLGHTLLGEFVMQEADRDSPVGGRRALAGALRAQAAVLDRLLGVITREYEQELQRAGRSPEQRRAQRVRGLVAGGSLESPGLGFDVSQDLDYDLGGWHLGMIVTGPRAADTSQELAARLRRRLLSVPQGGESVWAWLGGADGLAPGEIERSLAALAVADGAKLALGEPAWELRGWRLTHQQAQAALVVALRRPHRLTRYADVALLATALKDPLLADALIDIYLSPLDDADGRGALLRETLRAYLAAERNASSAAAALGVVRGTIENRLATIEERLGRSLHPCPAELEIALALDDLSQPASSTIQLPEVIFRS